MIMMENQKIKQDAGKPDISLVPADAVFDIAEVREYGNNKYGDPDAWKEIDPVRLMNAAGRHLLKMFKYGAGAIDEESGMPHYKHLICNAAMICGIMAEQEPAEKTIGTIKVGVQIRNCGECHEGMDCVSKDPEAQQPLQTFDEEVPTVQKVLFDWKDVEKVMPLNEDLQKRVQLAGERLEEAKKARAMTQQELDDRVREMMEKARNTEDHVMDAARFAVTAGTRCRNLAKSAPGDEKPPKGYRYAKGGITIPKSKIKGKKKKKNKR